MNATPTAGWVALVGQRDEPTDGVRDYCAYLAGALARRGIGLAVNEVAWAERGWFESLRQLWKAARSWDGRWVLFQYTPLGWSRRGFPFGAVLAIAVLRLRAARTAVVFHDWSGYGGPRAVDRMRWACQRWVMRRISVLARCSLFPLPVENVQWLNGIEARAAFIPIGANLPAPCASRLPREQAGELTRDSRIRTVAVFGVTGGESGVTEVEAIAGAIRRAAARVPGLRLVVMGRGSVERRSQFDRMLEGCGVELSVLGVLPAQPLAAELSRADALLFVRGEVTGQRGSAIAGISCGIPVVGYGDTHTAFPLSEGGVILVPRGDQRALGEALERVLTDESLESSLRERSVRAHAEYFCWDRIAERFAEALTHE